MAIPDDPYYKKTVSLSIGRLGLAFRVSQTLFSSHRIDAGTELLLRTLHRTGGEVQKVLDLGCGYGPIGIALKALNPSAALHMVDRDALAVAYAAQNALLNGIKDYSAYPSIGFDDVEDRDFDLIAANIPGKAGEAVIASWLREAPLFLRSGGRVGIVVVSALEALVSEVIGGIPQADIALRRRRAGHTVFVYTVDEAPDRSPAPVRSFERGCYDRADAAFAHGRASYRMKTVFGLPEFDSLSYQTELLFTVLDRMARKPTASNILVVNPGQGHIPVLLSKLLMPDSIDMVGRDLLALRCSARNLLLNGYDPTRTSVYHRVDMGREEPRYDLVVADLGGDDGAEVMAARCRQAIDRIASGGRMVVAGSSPTITRLIDMCQSERLITVSERKRRRGSSALVAARSPDLKRAPHGHAHCEMRSPTQTAARPRAS